MMKNVLIAATALLGLVVSANAKDATVRGLGVCAKCELGETSTCQNAIVVEKDGKKTTYYLEHNDTSKGYHSNVCSKTTKTIAYGDLKEVEGKAVLVAAKILVDKGDVTIAGKGVCAKCELGETKTCQNAIQVEKDGKTVTYYLEQNDVSKMFHKNVCSSPTDAMAVGVVAEENGKMVMIAVKEAKTEKLTGKGVCAKCELGETKTCQNAIQVEKDGKTLTYYLVQNDVSKSFHKNVCSGPAPTSAIGAIEEVEGKLILTSVKLSVVE
jgi:capsid protein